MVKCFSDQKADLPNRDGCENDANEHHPTFLMLAMSDNQTQKLDSTLDAATFDAVN